MQGYSGECEVCERYAFCLTFPLAEIHFSVRVLHGNDGECEVMHMEGVVTSWAGTHSPLASRDLQSTPVFTSVQGNTRSVQSGECCQWNARDV